MRIILVAMVQCAATFLDLGFASHGRYDIIKWCFENSCSDSINAMIKERSRKLLAKGTSIS